MTEDAPPTPAQLYAALMKEFRSAGWEIYFRGTDWAAWHPDRGTLTSSSAIGLREAIETAAPNRKASSISPSADSADGHISRRYGHMGNVEQCRQCGGSGKVTVYKTDKDGKSKPVQQDCGGCRGSGVIPR